MGYSNDDLASSRGKRDNPAKPHTAIRSGTGIDGVYLFCYPKVGYEHGSLTEILHPEWQELFEEQILHCYFITNHRRSAQEWHYHEYTTDRYSVVSGTIEIALFDPRADSPTKNTLIKLELVGLSLGIDGNHGIRIPKGVWHSIKSPDDFILMNFKTKAFNRKQPDKFRVPMPNNLCNFTWAYI